MSQYRVTLFSRSSSIAFSPAIPTGLNVVGQASYSQVNASRRSWQNGTPYSQKALFTDNILIQVHTQLYTGASGNYPKLYLCDGYGSVISGIDLNSAPYLKSVQHVPGNSYVDPFTGVSVPLNTTTWVFNFADFPMQIPQTGYKYYFLRMDNVISSGDPTISNYSEPILVSANHDTTMLFQFNYNTNIAKKNIIVSGLYDDFPTNSVTYTPTFALRCEGYIKDMASKVINIGYAQQGWEQRQIMTDQKIMFELRAGEGRLGIPYYMLRKLTEAVLSDFWAVINNGDTAAYSYIVFNNGSSTALTDLWKIKESEGLPLIFANCILQERDESQQALVSPPTDYFARIHDGTYDPTYD